jgi:hypothetical protein
MKFLHIVVAVSGGKTESEQEGGAEHLRLLYPHFLLPQSGGEKYKTQNRYNSTEHHHIFSIRKMLCLAVKLGQLGTTILTFFYNMKPPRPLIVVKLNSKTHL